jgi:hypothetical protein
MSRVRIVYGAAERVQPLTQSPSFHPHDQTTRFCAVCEGKFRTSSTLQTCCSLSCADRLAHASGGARCDS